MDNWINDIDAEESARLIDEGFRAEIRRIWTEVMDRSNHSLDCNPDECGHSGVCEAKRR